MNDLINRIEAFVQKSRIYLKQGEKPPKGVQVIRGKRGGMYYDTSNVSQGSSMLPQSKTTTASVNRKLKELGIKERLTRGKGYYYWYGGDAEKWHSSSIPVYNISNMKVDDLINDLKEKKREHKKGEDSWKKYAPSKLKMKDAGTPDYVKEFKKSLKYAYRHSSLNMFGKSDWKTLTPDEIEKVLDYILKSHYPIRPYPPGSYEPIDKDEFLSIFKDTFKTEISEMKKVNRSSA